MGMLGTILGGVAGFALGGPAGAFTGAQLGGGFDANQARADAAEAANQFSAQQYATRYQTTVKDLEAAGLSPMLAYSQGAGSAPSGQMASAQNPAEGISAAYQQSQLNAAAVAKTQADTKVSEAQAENVVYDTLLKKASIFKTQADASLSTQSAEESKARVGFMEVQSKKLTEEIKNIPREGERIVALTKQLGSLDVLMKQQGLTEVQRTDQMKWLAVKTMLDSDLISLDVEAAKKFDNFAREYKQYEPIVRLLQSILRHH